MSDLRGTHRELGSRVEAALDAENGDIRCLRASEIFLRATKANATAI